MPAYLPDFFIIPRQVAQDPNIKPIDEKVYAVIYWFSQMRLQRCTLSNDSIAELVGCSVVAARKGISNLIKHGYIRASYEDVAKTKRLELVPLVVMGGDTTVSGGVIPQYQGGDTTVSHNKNNKKEIYINNNSGTSYSNTKNSYIEETSETDFSTLAVSVTHGSVEEAAKIIIGHFNETYGTRYKTNSRTYQKNLEYWLEEYSIEEIKQAITNARHDTYWAPIFKGGGQALELLLRKEKAKTGGGEVEKVDRIGQFLNVKVPVAVRPLTDIEFYHLCKKLNVPPDHTKNHYDFLMEKAEKGEFKNPDDDETVAPALTRWIEKEKSNGTVAECNEFDVMDIDDLHPRRLAEIALFKKQNEYQRIVEDFTKKKKKFSSVEADEDLARELKELAQKGKSARAELAQAKDQLRKMRQLYGVS